MSKDNERVTGARKLEPATGPDPRDDFSQKAAENKKPPNGDGLEESVDEGREPDRTGPVNDARPQFVRTREGAENNGVSSADPRVISGKEDGDATFSVDPEDEKPGRK